MSNSAQSQLNKYLENRMNDLERRRFDETLLSDPGLNNELLEMEEVFDFLDSGLHKGPSSDFTSDLYERINHEQRHILKLNKLLAHSCIAAGITLIFIDGAKILQDFANISFHFLEMFN